MNSEEIGLCDQNVSTILASIVSMHGGTCFIT